ncbi:MAG: hypothetical protein MJZ32_07630 [Bacteroidaceae bacterium]|nr:hypothetical protein [Bacteroidaceae bacterium]
MKKILISIIALTLGCLTAVCQEKIILLNEGNWQADNAKITYFENGKIVSNQWFRDKNGYKIGDTPNDIIQINDNLIAIAVNWSNIIQFITPEGKAVAATEDVPNNRRLASDGDFVYVTSYGHECGINGSYKEFEKGFVAKIDCKTFKVVDAVEVGYEPEGIALYKGHLFVANSGGYAFQEDHEYESTVNIIDCKTMKIVKTIDTGCVNLYGGMAQSGKYLLINSAGDYYNQAGCSVLMDCEKALNGENCFKVLDVVATQSTTNREGQFLVVGSDYSFLIGGYELSYCTINPEEAYANGSVQQSFPGTIAADIENMKSPYSIYVNPYTGYIYATDASSYADGGKLYQWSPEGELLGTHKVYINPGHFLALPPDGHYTGISTIQNAECRMQNYNIAGQRVGNGYKGIIIQGNKKIFKK